MPNPQRNSTILEAALELEAHGLSVIPLLHKDKKPAVSWEAYQGARADSSDLTNWFANSQRNIGIVTGSVSGIVVLDVDHPEALPRLEIPKTPTVRTGKGYHYYFKRPDRSLRNGTLRGIGDLRSDGGYVVAPPSVHPNGYAYTWEVGLDQPLAEVPQWLIDLASSNDALLLNDNVETTEYGKAWFNDCLELADARKGGRNNLLNTVACKAGSLIASGHLNEAEARKAMLDSCYTNGLVSDDGLPQVRQTINSGLSKGKDNPRDPLEREPQELPKGSKLTLRRAADITPESIDWLWEGVLAKGAISILGGDPGLGKSQASLSIASIITKGDYWPGSKQRAELGDVIVISMEDSPEHVIVPRLRACGADQSRVHILSTVCDDNGTRPFNLEHDVSLLRDAVADLGSVRLIIIDPITAYLGRSDVNNSGDVRAITNQLAELAQEHSASVLMLHHLNKGKDQPAAYRMQGSIAWTGAARTTFVIDRDKEDQECRVMAPAKNNYAIDTTAYRFTVKAAEIDDGIKTSCVVWENSSHTSTADQVLAEKGETGDALREAEQFLVELLKNGRVPSVVANQAARQMQISDSTLKRAKKKLGVVGVTDDNVVWYWGYSGA